jgi:hypothetical protein
MASIHQHLFTVTSNNGAARQSDPVFVGGMRLEFQGILAQGATLLELQLSPDRINWATAEDNSGTAITGLGAVNRNVESKGQWARLQVASDVGGARVHAAVLTVRKDV